MSAFKQSFIFIALLQKPELLFPVCIESLSQDSCLFIDVVYTTILTLNWPLLIASRLECVCVSMCQLYGRLV